ncbi:ADP-ribosylation factor-like protein [Legionella spiritensis]|uniref:ADP-ribosylation factor-like protein n=1 Tax=Legionella spiritensis TaxID=452 RepID=UPI000F6CAD04|nr:ADP-ribosylation factor-like protein [Legionella spiritensis]VEG90072.1 Ras family GTPase [Legionella spiritensis]
MPTIYIDNTADVKKYEKAINYILDTIDEKKIEEYVCPVSGEFMSEPMSMPGEDRYCYDKSTLEDWFREHNTHPYTRKTLTGNPIEHFEVNHPLQRLIFKFLNKKLAKLHDEKPELFPSEDKIAAEEISLDSDKGKERIEIEEASIDYDTSATSFVETEDVAVATPFNPATHTPDMLDIFDITSDDYFDIINGIITLDDASIIDACEADENTAVCVLLTPFLLEKITLDQAETLRGKHEKVQTAFALIPALQTETSEGATRKTSTVVESIKKIHHTRNSPPVKHEVRAPARSFFEPSATTPSHVGYSTYSTPIHSSSDEVELHKIKVLLLGDSSVGKSRCMSRYVDGTFPIRSVRPLSGFDLKRKQITTHDKQVELSIFEHTNGKITTSMIQDVSAVMIVFDVCDRDSFTKVDKHLKLVERYSYMAEPRTILLLANKTDLEGERAISSEEILRFADELGLAYFETSALTGKNITEAFELAAEQTLIKRGIIEKPEDIVPEEGPSTPPSSFYKRFFKKSPKAVAPHPEKLSDKEAFNYTMPKLFPIDVSNSDSDLHQIKIMIFGACAVGKTSCRSQYLNNTFSSVYSPRGFGNTRKKQIMMHGKPINLYLSELTRVENWNRHDDDMRKDIHAAILIIDVTDRNEMSRCRSKIKFMKKHMDCNIVKILLANKTDMVSKRAISLEEIKSLAEEYNFDAYYETSAKTGKNINLAFTKAAEYHLIKHGHIEKPYEDEKEQADKRCVIC